MKKILALASALFLTSVSLYAQQRAPLVTKQDKTQSSPRLNPVQQHARELSYQMTRDLHLNGYQKTRLQAINNDKQTRIVAILQQNAGNDKLIKDQCDAVCKERDQELQAVLSTDQYSSYYGSRREYNDFSMSYKAQATNDAFVKSVKDPAPVSSKGATIGPARTAK
ncbi:hypothetical protein [Hymenobacter rubripertinctus]|uniref:DUF4168 domain-containing protein n=1 Tax=Hymenobacter rubripertinctus TaxID=2029981 RepID=A0A418QPL8_9BACT|nr:hypothetical protein [Hymenobacter rubripertinctus]RIY07165.1 hypothetical protein D0T11_17320 [Hymenobacter rubripertinctus]